MDAQATKAARGKKTSKPDKKWRNEKGEKPKGNGG